MLVLVLLCFFGRLLIPRRWSLLFCFVLFCSSGKHRMASLKSNLSGRSGHLTPDSFTYFFGSVGVNCPDLPAESADLWLKRSSKDTK